jgi:hypothetical protein
MPRTRMINPASLVIGHIVSRDQAKALGWFDDRINSRANTQPEHARCSARSGGRYSQQKKRAKLPAGQRTPAAAQVSVYPTTFDQPLRTSREW